MIDGPAWAEVVELLRAAARTEIMPRFRKLDAGAIRTKSSPTDLVTEADEQAEAMITAGLKQRFPGCRVIGEEACAADPSVLGTLAGEGLAFVVDPVDGTSNYVAGLPLFGVMVAAVHDGAVIASAIHDPVSDDTAVAIKGEGAAILSPGADPVMLRVSSATDPAQMSGCVSWRFMKEPLRGTVVRNMVGLGGVADYRCAAHEYRMLAAGHFDYLVFNRLMPWDHLPGWLLHQEAGGFSAHFDGSDYLPEHTTGGLICTPDRAGFNAIAATLMPPEN